MPVPSFSRLMLPFLFCCISLVMSGCRGDNEDRGTDGGAGEQPANSPVGATAVTGATAATKDEKTTALKYKKGQNNYTIKVDGLERQFIVHVPSGYAPDKSVPLIFVFHMGAHNGGHAYETTKWREQCEKEACITVYPTALKYFVIEENQTQTTWNDLSATSRVPPGTSLADDVKFVERMVEVLKATFNIDSKRIYASGASNGGMFVSSRIVMELPQIFAAAGINLVLVTNGQPPMDNQAIPSYVTFGSLDPVLLEFINEKYGLSDKEMPLEATKIMQHPFLGGLIPLFGKTLGLDASYTVEYCVPKLDRCTATYSSALEAAEGLYTTLTFANGAKPGVELRFRMINGMGHSYPTAANNPAHLQGAAVEWEFFMDHPKP